MSATSTVHFACDGCGKRADAEREHPNQNVLPDAWRSTQWGEFCSEPCYRQVLVARAIDRAAQEFAPAATTPGTPS